MTLFDVGVQVLVVAAAHRGDPVAEVRDAFVRPVEIGARGLEGSRLVLGAEEGVVADIVGNDHVTFAAEKDLADALVLSHEGVLVAHLRFAVGVPVAVFNRHQGIVFRPFAEEGERIRRVRVVVVAGYVAVPHAHHGDGMVLQSQAPAHLVDVVDQLIGHVAAGEVLDPVPAAMVEAAVLDHLGRPHPAVPIQPWRHGLRIMLPQITAQFVGYRAGHVQLADHALLTVSASLR